MAGNSETSPASDPTPTNPTAAAAQRQVANNRLTTAVTGLKDAQTSTNNTGSGSGNGSSTTAITRCHGGCRAMTLDLTNGNNSSSTITTSSVKCSQACMHFRGEPGNSEVSPASDPTPTNPTAAAAQRQVANNRLIAAMTGLKDAQTNNPPPVCNQACQHYSGIPGNSEVTPTPTNKNLTTSLVGVQSQMSGKLTTDAETHGKTAAIAYLKSKGYQVDIVNGQPQIVCHSSADCAAAQTMYHNAYLQAAQTYYGQQNATNQAQLHNAMTQLSGRISIWPGESQSHYEARLSDYAYQMVNGTSLTTIMTTSELDLRHAQAAGLNVNSTDTTTQYDVQAYWDVATVDQAANAQVAQQAIMSPTALRQQAAHNASNQILQGCQPTCTTTQLAQAAHAYQTVMSQSTSQYATPTATVGYSDTAGTPPPDQATIRQQLAGQVYTWYTQHGYTTTQATQMQDTVLSEPADQFTQANLSNGSLLPGLPGQQITSSQFFVSTADIHTWSDLQKVLPVGLSPATMLAHLDQTGLTAQEKAKAQADLTYQELYGSPADAAFQEMGSQLNNWWVAGQNWLHGVISAVPTTQPADSGRYQVPTDWNADPYQVNSNYWRNVGTVPTSFIQGMVTEAYNDLPIPRISINVPGPQTQQGGQVQQARQQLVAAHPMSAGLVDTVAQAVGRHVQIVDAPSPTLKLNFSQYQNDPGTAFFQDEMALLAADGLIKTGVGIGKGVAGVSSSGVDVTPADVTSGAGPDPNIDTGMTTTPGVDQVDTVPADQSIGTSPMADVVQEPTVVQENAQAPLPEQATFNEPQVQTPVDEPQAQPPVNDNAATPPNRTPADQTQPVEQVNPQAQVQPRADRVQANAGAQVRDNQPAGPQAPEVANGIGPRTPAVVDQGNPNEAALRAPAEPRAGDANQPRAGESARLPAGGIETYQSADGRPGAEPVASGNPIWNAASALRSGAVFALVQTGAYVPLAGPWQSPVPLPVPAPLPPSVPPAGPEAPLGDNETEPTGSRRDSGQPTTPRAGGPVQVVFELDGANRLIGMPQVIGDPVPVDPVATVRTAISQLKESAAQVAVVQDIQDIQDQARPANEPTTDQPVTRSSTASALGRAKAAGAWWNGVRAAMLVSTLSIRLLLPADPSLAPREATNLAPPAIVRSVPAGTFDPTALDLGQFHVSDANQAPPGQATPDGTTMSTLVQDDGQPGPGVVPAPADSIVITAPSLGVPWLGTPSGQLPIALPSWAPSSFQAWEPHWETERYRPNGTMRTLSLGMVDVALSAVGNVPYLVHARVSTATSASATRWLRTTLSGRGPPSARTVRNSFGRRLGTVLLIGTLAAAGLTAVTSTALASTAPAVTAPISVLSQPAPPGPPVPTRIQAKAHFLGLPGNIETTPSTPTVKPQPAPQVTVAGIESLLRLTPVDIVALVAVGWYGIQWLKAMFAPQDVDAAIEIQRGLGSVRPKAYDFTAAPRLAAWRLLLAHALTEAGRSVPAFVSGDELRRRVIGRLRAGGLPVPVRTTAEWNRWWADLADYGLLESTDHQGQPAYRLSPDLLDGFRHAGPLATALWRAPLSLDGVVDAALTAVGGKPSEEVTNLRRYLRELVATLGRIDSGNPPASGVPGRTLANTLAQAVHAFGTVPAAVPTGFWLPWRSRYADALTGVTQPLAAAGRAYAAARLVLLAAQVAERRTSAARRRADARLRKVRGRAAASAALAHDQATDAHQQATTALDQAKAGHWRTRDAVERAVPLARLSAALAGIPDKAAEPAIERSAIGWLSILRPILVSAYDGIGSDSVGWSSRSSNDYANTYRIPSREAGTLSNNSATAAVVTYVGLSIGGDLAAQPVVIAATGGVGAVSLFALGLTRDSRSVPGLFSLLGIFDASAGLLSGMMRGYFAVPEEFEVGRNARQLNWLKLVRTGMPVLVLPAIAIWGLRTTMIGVGVAVTALTAVTVWAMRGGVRADGRRTTLKGVAVGLWGATEQVLGTPNGITRFVLSPAVTAAADGVPLYFVAGAIDKLLNMVQPGLSAALTVTAIIVLNTAANAVAGPFGANWKATKARLGNSEAEVLARGNLSELLFVPAIVALAIWPTPIHLWLALTAGIIAVNYGRAMLNAWAPTPGSASRLNAGKTAGATLGILLIHLLIGTPFPLPAIVVGGSLSVVAAIAVAYATAAMHGHTPGELDTELSKSLSPEKVSELLDVFRALTLKSTQQIAALVRDDPSFLVLPDWRTKLWTDRRHSLGLTAEQERAVLAAIDALKQEFPPPNPLRDAVSAVAGLRGPLSRLMQALRHRPLTP